MKTRRAVIIRNNILSIGFVLMMGYMVFKTDIIHNLTGMMKTIMVRETASDNKQAETETVETITEHIEELLPGEEQLINLSGVVMKRAGVRSYYNEEYGINVTSDGYIVTGQAQTSAEYEIDQMTRLKQYLDERGIKLLYVSKPSKYMDDDYYQEQFGDESYLNRNTDRFLEGIKAAEIDFLDLRTNIREEGLDCMELFFRTDHHWKPQTAKWAAEKIAKKLNESYGYDIDINLYADKNFQYEEYYNCWLGEMGRKVAESYVGLDDFTLVTPLYDTSYTKTIDGQVKNGDFDLFIDSERFADTIDAKSKGIGSARLKSWYYIYTDDGQIHNNKADYGNVLIMGDSFEETLVPFLSLGLENVCKIAPRSLDAGKALEIIDSGNYDTVIVSYVQSVIGAHENPESANRRAFSFFD